MRRPSTTTPGTRRRVRSWGLPVLCAVVTALTPIVCAVSALRGNWVPSNDWAVVVAKGYDTFSSHPPLFGQWTSLSSYLTYDVYQPGPIQFWFLGVPEHLFAPSTFGPLFGEALLTSLMAVVFLVTAHRRGGLRLLAPASVVLMLVFHSLGAEIIRSPYNPSAAVFGLVAYLAAAWSILCDDDVLWPALIFAGSLSVQSHVTYLIPMGCIGALIVVARLVGWRRGTGVDRSRRYRVTVVGLSLATTVLCWIGPFIDQFWGTGNLRRLISSGMSATDPIGPAFALHRLVEQLAVWPRWIIGPWVLGPEHPTLWTWVSAVLVCLALIAAVVQSHRSGARTRFRMGLIAVAALVGAFVGSARIPNEHLAIQAPNNRLLWWPTAAFAWLFLFWSLAAVLTPVVRRAAGRRRLPALDVPAAALALVVLAVTGGLIVRNGQPRYDFVSVTYGEVAGYSAAGARRCVGRSEPIAVTGDASANAGSMSGVVAMLLLRGCDVHTTNWEYFGIDRKFTGREPIELRISASPHAPPGFHLIARWDPKDPPPKWEHFTSKRGFVTSTQTYLYQRGG